MQADIVLPDLGTNVVRLSLWLADRGDSVYEGDCLAEVLVAGATFDVASPASGDLVEKFAFPDDLLRPGQLLGRVEVDEEEGNP